MHVRPQSGYAEGMAILTRRKKSKKERALSAVGTAASAAGTYVKAKVAWLVGRKATKVAAPAVAVGTAAVVAKKRHDRTPAAV
jgi:uncharacterized membrane protein